jgi:hypothetical protein
MISGAHVILFTNAPDETRAFVRDHLHLSAIDAGGGWLIFALPPAELAVHPAVDARHELYLTTPDLEATIEELTRAGATFGPTEQASWGRIAPMTMPGGTRLSIYQPSHPSPSRSD